MKDNKENLLEHFAIVSDAANAKLIQYIRGYIFNLMSIYGLSKEDVAQILDHNLENVDEFLNEKWEGVVSSKVLVRLMLNGFDCSDINKCLQESREFFDSTYFLSMFGKKNAYREIVKNFHCTTREDVDTIIDMLENCKALLEDKDFVNELLEKNGTTEKI